MKKVTIYALLTVSVLTSSVFVNASAVDGRMGRDRDKPVLAAVIKANQSVDYLDAVLLFKKQYGTDIRIKSVSFEGKHRPYYKVKGFNPYNQKTLKIYVDTGEVFNEESNKKDVDWQKKDVLSLSSLITPQIAMDIAMKAVNKETQVSEWSLERGQDGNVCYEFELVDNGGNEKEVKIDAVIGKIVSVK